MNMPLVSMNRRRRIGGAATPVFSPSALFALAEPGVWYDPSDLTTLFQDTAGTQPVTTPGQTVALALDKSKGLVLGSELVTNGTFDSGTTGWVAGFGLVNGTFTASGGIATLTQGSSDTSPRFVTTLTGLTVGNSYRLNFTSVGQSGSGDKYVVWTNSSNGTGGTTLNQGGALNWGGQSRTFLVTATATTMYVAVGLVSAATGASVSIDNISVKELPGFHATQATLASRPTYALMPPSGKRNLLNNTNTLATQTLMMTAAQHTLSFRGTGTVTLTGASTAGPLVGTGASNIVSLTFTPTANNLTLTVSGTVNDAQLELGAARTTYQTVTNDGYNVTEAGITSLPCLSFNGVNNFLVTPTITPGIDKAQVFAGVRKLTDANYGCIAETSTGAASNAAIAVFVNTASNGKYYLQSGSLSTDGVTDTSTTVPNSDVLTVNFDRSGASASNRIQARIDGAASAITFSGVGVQTGNFGAFPLYIGRRGGASLPFNGNLFSLIVRFGTNLDAGTITSTETWVNQRTGAF